MEGANE
jgi:hypothetical protein